MRLSYRYPLIAVSCLILLLLGLLIVMRPWGHNSGRVTSADSVQPPLVLPDAIGTDAGPPNAKPAPARTGKIDLPGKIDVASRGTGREEPVSREPMAPMTVPGKVDSWEDWNSSFSDTVTRTYSAIFDSARLDTLPGARLVFSPTGREKDFAPVTRVFCIVDSVRPLVKYTFPGQSVEFGIGVGFAAGVSLRGELRPQDKTCSLEIFYPEGGAADEYVKSVRNQFIVVFNSSPGYAYTLKTGIECVRGEVLSASRIYYTRPAVVEFRRMVRFSTLARDAGDTVLILSSNPKAIEEIARVVRRSLINAVFIPATDRSEADALEKEELTNVHLHISAPRVLDQSFVVLNDSEAIVEKNILDPDFKHTVQLKLKESQMNRIGYPRVTRLYRSEESVLELKLLFRHYERLAP